MVSKTIVIRDGVSEIGVETALIYSKNKNNIVFLLDSESNLKKNNKIILDKVEGRIKFINRDNYNNSEINALKKISDINQRIDVLINDTRIYMPKNNKIENEEEKINNYQKKIKDNIKVSKFVLPLMVNNKYGAIINVSSIFGIKAWPKFDFFYNTNNFLNQLTEQFAVEYGKYNIRINCICVGPTNDFISKNLNLFGKDLEKVKNELISMHPLGRLVEPYEIAKAIEFLVSDKASFINGVILRIDGGFSVK